MYNITDLVENIIFDIDILTFSFIYSLISRFSDITYFQLPQASSSKSLVVRLVIVGLCEKVTFRVTDGN